MGDKGCVLVTGGAGYIGSHCVIALIEAGYSPVIVDNLVNSSRKCLKRVEEITGKSIVCYKVDLVDRPALKEVFQKHKFTHVIHLAGLKAVGESVQLPLLYYKNNIDGTLCLLNVMKEFDVKQLVFSSSATVYGDPQYLPLDEKHPVGSCTNPYGKTKYFIEEILKDLCTSDKSFNVVSLRYFNPVGCHKSGLIGEDPCGVPNNLMPFVAQVAIGRREKVMVYGNDYNTKDGTGVRDYIHVVDLANGHVAAMNKLSEQLGFTVYNLGTGTGSSVLDMIKTLQTASGRTIPYEIVGRRGGDCGSVYADPSLAEKELSWKAIRGLNEMCEDLWRWQSNNPNGFGDNNE